MTIKNSFVKISILIIIFIVISLSGCFSHWQSDAAQIVISFGGAERKIYDPEDTETHNKLEHEVIFTNGTKKLTFNKSGTTFEAIVAPGEWKITINSWIDGEIYATGSINVILKPGLNSETIEMEQVIFWWAWDSDLENNKSTTKTTIIPTADRSGYDVMVEGDEPNVPYLNWKSQINRTYIATAGKTYKASWKWQTTDGEPFNNVTIRYTQENPPEETDILYEFDTNENKLTIPTSEEEKIYEFTMPEIGNTQYNHFFAFLVGEDTGSFRIWDFRIEEVKLPSSIKRITFTHNKGTVGSNGEPYDNWLGFYDIPSSVRGNKINAGDVFTFNYTFTSDVTIEKDDWAMSIVLVDNSATAEPQYWKELSSYYPIHSIKAKEEVSDTITLTANEIASSSSVEANRLAFIIDLKEVEVKARHPTLTFTKFEFKKAQAAGSTNRVFKFTHSTGADFDNWIAFYDIPSSVRGNRINAGDVFIFTYSFKSDIAINSFLQIDLNDHSKGWNPISDWTAPSRIQMSDIPAGTAVSGTIIFTANKASSSSAADANRLSFLIDTFPGMKKGPTLTFTEFSLIKAQTAQGGNLNAKLEWINSNAQNRTAYIITQNNNEDLAPQDLSCRGNNVIIILKGDTTERTVNLSRNGSLFTINSGVTLILDNNITLKGLDSNNTSLVRIHSWGTLIMNEGAKIKDNIMTTNNTTSGGGVSINEGTFIMKGGEISGNKSLGPAQKDVWYLGGGVQVYKGIFNMEGGKISNNESADSGGGIEVAEDGIFIMSGNAEISDNISYGGVGGVYVTNGTFTMNGGTISGNKGGGDGGVNVVWEKGKFTMNGGKITGNTAGLKEGSGGGGGVGVWRGIFYKTKNGGTIYENFNNGWGAKEVFASNDNDVYLRWRNTSISSDEELYYNPPDIRGTWDN